MINLKEKFGNKELVAILSILGLSNCNFISWQYSPIGIFSFLIWSFSIIFIIAFLITFLRCDKLTKKKLIAALAIFGVMAFILWQSKPPSGLNIFGLFIWLIFSVVILANWFGKDEE
ncbi:MAG: hypothetical protein ACYDA4_03840 [Ignavibacteriaceae bacterium]